MTISDERVRAELAALQERQIEALERIEAALLARFDAMGEEVRTRRVVLVDETGFERIDMNTSLKHGSIKLYGKPVSGEAPPLELLIDVSEESAGEDAGVHLSHMGDFVASLYCAVDEDGQARVRLDVGDTYVAGGSLE